MPSWLDLKKGKALFLIGLPILLMSATLGCSSESSWRQRVQNGHFFLLQLLGFSNFRSAQGEPGKESKPEREASPSFSQGTALVTSSVGLSSKQHLEILAELFRVVFDTEVTPKAELGLWVDTWNQGASLEGVYRGITLSSLYQTIEKQAKTASVGCLKVFSEELALLETELPQPTVWDEKPLAPLEKKIPQREESHPSPQQLIQKYQTFFLPFSFFYLKRLLGEEALKVLEVKKQRSQHELALWYSHWVVRLLSHQVDFGMNLRNSAEIDFHYRWVLSAPWDHLQWEVLNRVHRLMNQKNRL